MAELQCTGGDERHICSIQNCHVSECTRCYGLKISGMFIDQSKHHRKLEGDMGYWRERYGFQTQDFIRGVIAGIEAYAVWNAGEQHVGVQQTPLEIVIEEVKADLGWERDAVTLDPGKE